MKTNVLFYGDNLTILRNKEYFPDESVDLIYLDPPFSSKRDYNLLFKESDQWSEAQIKPSAIAGTGVSLLRRLFRIYRSTALPKWASSSGRW